MRKPVGQEVRPVPLDARDEAIIDALQRDGRMAYTELGRVVGMSGTAAAERVSRLMDLGVIRGFRADIQPEAVGLGVGAVVHFTPTDSDHDAVLQKLLLRPEIVTAHVVSGDAFAILIVRVRSLNQLNQFLAETSKIGRSKSFVMLESWDRPIQ